MRAFTTTGPQPSPIITELMAHPRSDWNMAKLIGTVASFGNMNLRSKVRGSGDLCDKDRIREAVR